jgi:hypothetical protein
VVAASHELGQDYEHVTVSAGRTPCRRVPGRVGMHWEIRALPWAEHQGAGAQGQAAQALS